MMYKIDYSKDAEKEVEHFLTADYKSAETPNGTSGGAEKSTETPNGSYPALRTSGRAEHLFEHFLYFYTKIFGSLEGFMYICKKYSNYGS